MWSDLLFEEEKPSDQGQELSLYCEVRHVFQFDEEDYAEVCFIQRKMICNARNKYYGRPGERRSEWQ